MKVITVMQTKGGVAKTTTTYLLAIALSRRGQNVLVIDADGQMDLTRLFLEPMLEPQDDGDTMSIIDRHGLISLFEAMQKFRQENRLSDLLTKTLDLPAQATYTDGRDDVGKIHLMVGHPDTTSQDEHIGAAQSTLWSFPINRNVPNAPGYIVRFAATNLAVDIVLIDTNPNQGLLNAYLWWASDFYLVPCAPEPPCFHAIGNLANRLQKRTASILSILPELEMAKTIKPVRQEAPVCLGLVMTTHNDCKKVVTSVFPCLLSCC